LVLPIFLALTFIPRFSRFRLSHSTINHPLQTLDFRLEHLRRTSLIDACQLTRILPFLLDRFELELRLEIALLFGRIPGNLTPLDL